MRTTASIGLCRFSRVNAGRSAYRVVSRPGLVVAFELAATLLFVAPRLSAEPSAATDAGAEPSASSSGQPDTAHTPAAAAITPPLPLDTSVAYPDGATESADIVLEITVGSDGRVLDPKVVSGQPALAEAALAAARTWRFEPARRGGQPIAARIRYVLHFTAPSEPKIPSDADEGAPPPPGLSAGAGLSGSNAGEPPSEPAEIVVHGERAGPGAVTLTREEARALPGTFGDPLRAIEAEPGVVPIVSGLPTFFIRGAPPANVGFFIDGVDVPLLYHAFFGPSVIHPGLIDRVTLFGGASPVEYGRFAGPVVEVETRPFEHRWNGEAAVRAIDAGALVEAPFGSCSDRGAVDCSPGSARAGGRYSYTGPVLSALSSAQLDYWDYQGQVSYDLGPHDTVGVLAFGAYDFFRTPEDVEGGGGKVTFHRVDLRYDHRSASGTKLRVALTGGFDHTSGADEGTSAVSDRSLRLRSSLSTPLSARNTLRTGFDARVDHYGIETDPLFLSYPDYSALFPARTELVAGAFAAADLEPVPGIRVSPGIRADVYRSQGTTAVGVDPRVLTSFDLSSRVRIEQSFGIAHQQANFAAQIPGAQVADLAGGLQEAVMFSSGVRVKLPSEINATATVFRAAYLHALDPIGGGRDFSIDRTVVERRTDVSSAGFELKIARSLTRRLGGSIAYTFSRTEESRGSYQSVSGFDRPHIVQAALGYAFSGGYRVGVRAILYSGVPELDLEGSPHFTTARRGPPYFRTDLRVEKRWKIGEGGYLGVIGEVLNATSTHEVVRLDCGEICRERIAGPVILPSIGVEAGF